MHAFNAGKTLTKDGVKSGLGIIFRTTTTVKTITETTILKVKNFLSDINASDIFWALISWIDILPLKY